MTADADNKIDSLERALYEMRRLEDKLVQVGRANHRWKAFAICLTVFTLLVLVPFGGLLGHAIGLAEQTRMERGYQEFLEMERREEKLRQRFNAQPTQPQAPPGEQGKD